MNTELLLYNRNLVDNYNFSEINQTAWTYGSSWSIGAKTLTLSFGTGISVVGTPLNINVTMPALPTGTVINSTTLRIVNAHTQGTSKRDEMRVALSGLITMSAAQLSTLASGGTIYPDPSILVPNPPITGGTITLTLSETVNQSGIDAVYGQVTLVMSYDVPGTILHLPGSTSPLTQTNILRSGVEYRVLFDVTGRTAGSITTSFGTVTSTAVSTNGTAEFIMTSDGTDLSFTPSSTFDGRISNVRVMVYPDVNSADLVDNILIPLTYNINDIKDISSRKGSYSKTVTLPGTKHNNNLFKHIYEIENDNIFNPNKKTKAVLLRDGIEIFNGILKLNKINRIENGLNNYDKISYEVVLSSSAVNVFDDLKNLYLTDLDFSEYDHVLTRPNQVASWSTSVIKNGQVYYNWVNGTSHNILSTSIHTDGTLLIETATAHGFIVDDQIQISTDELNSTTPFLYYEGDHKVREVVSSTKFTINIAWNPLYGDNLTGTVRLHAPTGEGYVYTHIDNGQNNDTNWKVTELTPAIYAKNIIDKMFNTVGATYDSDFLNSEFFKRLVIPPNGKGFRLTAAEIALRDFRVGRDSDDFFNVVFSPLSGPAVGGYPTGYDGHEIVPYAGTISSHTYSVGGIIVSDVRFNNEVTAPNFDPNNEYDPTSFIWTCPASGNYDLNVDAVLALGQDIPAGYDVITNINYGGFSTANPIFRILNVTTGTVAFSDSYTAPLNMVDNHIFSLRWTNQFLTAGDQYKVQIVIPKFFPYVIQSGDSSPTSTNLLMSSFNLEMGIRAGASFYTTFTNTEHAEGETISLVSVLPEKITCAEFFKGIISMFNLFVDVNKDNPKELIIQTRDDFYAQGATKDWTLKLDTSQTIELTPLGELTAKSYAFGYKPDKDFFNKKHEEEGGIVYGNYVKQIDTDFLTGTNTTEVVFSPSVIADLNSSGRPITTIVTANALPPQPKIEYNIRILYFSLNANGTYWYHQSIDDLPTTTTTYVSGAFTGTLTGFVGTYTGNATGGFLNVSGPHPFAGPTSGTVTGTITGYPGIVFSATVSGSTTGGVFHGSGSLSPLTVVTPNPGIATWVYPFVGHLDKACVGQIPTIDLNWNYPIKVYYPYNSWTDANLYNTYYKQMIEELTNKDSKVVSAYMYLKPTDIFLLNFRDHFFIDGHYLRLLQIVDYQVGSTKPTKCVFLKIETGLKFKKTSGIFKPGTVAIGEAVLAAPLLGAIGTGVTILGSGTKYDSTIKSMFVSGDDNFIGPNTRNISIIGSNNFVGGGLENVILINSNGLIINESNVTYINGVRVGPNLQPLSSGLNLIDGGFNEVLNPFKSNTNINLLDGGINTVLGLGSATAMNMVDPGLNDI